MFESPSEWWPLVEPGRPERSVLSHRMTVVDTFRMPPLGTSVVDDDGVALVSDWIASLAGCP